MEHLKITDLSVGDWVAYEDRPYRIYAIEECGTIRAKYEDEETLRQLQKHIDYFEPIPITPEILEKNGFANIESLWVIEDANQSISYFTEGKLTIVVNKKPQQVLSIRRPYIHQLQHAFRLAGIDKEIEL